MYISIGVRVGRKRTEDRQQEIIRIFIGNWLTGLIRDEQMIIRQDDRITRERLSGRFGGMDSDT